MELYQLNIYPVDYHRPDLVLTYSMNENKELEMFKIWISYKERNNIELINYANLLLYEIIINNDKKAPTERDIFMTYQFLFGYKKWRKYTQSKTYINNIKTLSKAPFNKYIEVTKDYINKIIDGMYSKYIKDNQNALNK